MAAAAGIPHIPVAVIEPTLKVEMFEFAVVNGRLPVSPPEAVCIHCAPEPANSTIILAYMRAASVTLR